LLADGNVLGRPHRSVLSFGMSAATGTIPLCLGLVFALAGCSHSGPPPVLTSDERLRHALIGTWTNDHGLLCLEADGSFWAQYESHTQLLPMWAYEGLWAATNDVLVFTCTNSRSWGTTNRSPTGTDTVRVVSIDGRTLRLAGSPYQTNSYTRSN
jgi:hypothetical protein